MNHLEQLSGVPSLPVVKGNGKIPIRGLKEGETVDVIPYTGYSKDSELFLPWAWRKFKDDGLVELYFPGMATIGFPDFVSMLSAQNLHVVLVVVRNPANEIIDLLGLATAGELPIGNVTLANCGFMFLKDFWDAKASSQAAQKIMRYWFDTLKLDVLIGLIASDNHLALRFVQRIGWSKKGALTNAHQYHGHLCDAVIFEITRKQFESLEAK